MTLKPIALAGVLFTVACARERTEAPPIGAPAPPATQGASAPLRDYLAHLEKDGDLYARDGGAIDSAPAADIAVLRGYPVGSSRVDLQACKLEYSIVSPK